jgi:hypothetical protein
MILLLLGIFGVAMCKSETSDEAVTDEEKTRSSINEKTPLSAPISTSDNNATEQQETDYEHNVEQNSKFNTIRSILAKSKNFLMGLFCCIGLGLFNGSMMVPARFVILYRDRNTILIFSRFNPDKSIIYIANFGIGVIIVTPILFVVYFLVKRQVPVFHVKKTMYPGLLVGFVWNIGNVCSTLASMSPLGLTVGFPLTQCALVVGGILGIVVFRELRGWKVILQFGLFTFLFLLPGCMLLAIFGKA